MFSTGSSCVSILPFLQLLEFSDLTSIQNLYFWLIILIVSTDKIVRRYDAFFFILFSIYVIKRYKISRRLLDIQQGTILYLGCCDIKHIFPIVLQLFSNLMCNLDHKLAIQIQLTA